MKKHWMLVLAILALTTGCNQQAARNALNDAKAAEQKAAAASKAEAELNQSKELAVADAKNVQVDLDEKTETSAKLNAHDVLSDAIEAAKEDDKALFVHFGADW